MHTVIVAIHLVAAASVGLLVLVQQGKGAESGASFGSGASATVFGSQGSSTFLSRLTAVFTVVFFVTSLGLAYFAKQQSKGLSNVGLPSASVMEKSSSSDVPVKPSVSGVSGSGDVPSPVVAATTGEPANDNDDNKDHQGKKKQERQEVVDKKDSGQLKEDSSTVQ